ncbi:MAG: hypothetical protein CMB80_22125 [Flammeovirgaceae bacterium]|nr:hypothetical protein [Flammeovirgaceae bacterium]HCX21809.1 hypothetical protein [Cytophagales bacterium]
MLRNFLLSSLRNFRKNKSFTFLNLLGLAVAICGIFTIYVFIQNELLVDSSIQEKNSTYLVTYTQQTESSSREIGLGDMQTDKWLLDKNSEVAASHHIRHIGESLVRNGNIKAERSITLTQSNFFDFFNIPLVQGDINTALSKPNSIILSESAAKVFFGDSNPIGQKLEIFGDYTMPLQVTGVIQEGVNLHFDYDCLVSWDSRPNDEPNTIGEWYRYSINSYIKSNNTSSVELANTLTARYQTEFPEENISINLYPISDLYFKIGHVQFLPGFKSGNKNSLTILSLIAVLILVISVVNYININISLVLKRLREIGMRKVMGASKLTLGSQFLVESTLLVLLASVIAITLSDLLIKELPSLFGAINGPFSNISYLWTLIGLSLLIGLLSGSYPALFISRIKLSDGLKSQLNGGKSRNIIRNSLMGLQFFITFGLLVMSIVVYQQYQFIQNKELGFNKEDILIVDIGNSGKITEGYRAFQSTINTFPEVKSTSVSTDIIGTGYTNNSYYAIKEGQTSAPENGVMTTYFSVDPDFTTTYDLQILEGRAFNRDLSIDSAGVIINEALVYKLGLENPVGSRIKLFGADSKSLHVLGVVKNFNFKSLHNEVTPIAMYLGRRNFWNLSIQFDRNNTAALMAKLENAWLQFDQDVPFSYEFLDDKLGRFYEQDQRFSKLISGFAIMSVILSLIGLFGLTAFSMEQRLKEISIRKILGADIKTLILLFNKQVIIVFTIASALALPLIYTLAGDWLSNFAFHIGNTWVIYISSAIIIFTLIVMTVTITSLKAANSNPAKYLKDD